MDKTVINWRPFIAEEMPAQRMKILVLIVPRGYSSFQPRVSTDTWMGDALDWHKEERVAYWCPFEDFELPVVARRRA